MKYCFHFILFSALFLLSFNAFSRLNLDFEGAGFFSEKQLEKELAHLPISQLKKELILKYNKEGFFNVKVLIEKIEKNEYKVRVFEDKQCKIKNVQFRNLNAKLSKEFKSKLKKNLSLPCTKSSQNLVILQLKKFLIKKNYLSHKILSNTFQHSSKKETANLLIHINLSFKYKFQFKGNKQFSDKSLLKELNFEDILKTNISLKDYISQKIKSIYYNLGYDGTKSHVLIEKNFIKVSMKEGTRTFIDEVRVRGRFSRSSRFYIQYILNNSSDFIKSGYYNDTDFDTGIKNLSNHVRNQGYVEFQFLSKSLKFSKDKKRVTIILTLNEGPLVTISKLNFSGNRSFTSRKLSEIMEFEIGSGLNFYEFEERLKKLKSFYDQFGYLDMKLEGGNNIVDYNERAKEVTLNFKISEGPQIKIKNIIVKGNKKAKKDFIIQQSKLKSGDILTSEKITRAISDLNSSEVFAFVNIDFKKTKGSYRTITISVQELVPGEIRTGFGLNREQGFGGKVYADLSYTNLKGVGQKISLSSELKRNFTFKSLGFDYLLAMTYVDPIFLKPNVKSITETSFQKEATDIETINGGEKINFTNSTKIGFQLEKGIDYNTTFNFNVWSWEFLRHFKIENSKTNFIDSEKVGLIGPSISLDYRNNRFFPTKGFYFNWGILYSTPLVGSSEGVHFIKTENTFSYYLDWTLGVLAQSLKLGYLKNLNSAKDSGVPKSYAFFLGGFSTLRGFSSTDPNNRLPLAKDFRDSGFDPDDQKSFIKDSSYFFLYKAESRFPIARKLNGVLFYDAGLVGVSHIRQKRPFRHSTGFGIRYKTPVGTVNLEWAFKVGYLDPQESRSRLHFSLGTF